MFWRILIFIALAFRSLANAPRVGIRYAFGITFWLDTAILQFDALHDRLPTEQEVIWLEDQAKMSMDKEKHAPTQEETRVLCLSALEQSLS